MRAVAAALACAAAVAVPAAAAAPATGGWSRPVTIEHGGHLALDAIATDRHEALVAWSGHSGTWTRVVRLGHASTPQRLSPTPIMNGSPRVVLDAHGDAAVAWQAEGRQVSSGGIVGFAPGPAYVAYRRAGGRFGPPHLIDRHAQQVSLGIDAAGVVTVAWVRGTPGRLATAPERLELTTRSAAGHFAAPAELAHGTGLALSLAVDPRGDALLAWENGGPPPQIQTLLGTGWVATRAAGGAFRTPRAIGRGGSSGITAAIAADGDATVAWEGPFDGSAVGNPFRGIQVQTISAVTGARGHRQAIVPPAGRILGDPGEPDSPALAVAPDAAAAIGWTTAPRASSEPTEIEVSRRAPGDVGFTAARPIAAGDAGEQVSVALGPGDGLLVAWDRLFGPDLRARLAAGPAAPLRSVLSPHPTLRFASDPLAAFGPSGRPELLWEQHGSGPTELALSQLR